MYGERTYCVFFSTGKTWIQMSLTGSEGLLTITLSRLVNTSTYCIFNSFSTIQLKDNVDAINVLAKLEKTNAQIQ